MIKSKFGRRLAVAGSIGLTALIVAGGVGAGTSGADPAPGYPLWNTGTIQAVRDSGSDTTFFVMQKISDLYNQAALYGCPVNTSSASPLWNNIHAGTAGLAGGLVNTAGTGMASNQTLSGSTYNNYCDSSTGTGGVQEPSTTDDVDNWSRTEVSEGVDKVGSGDGQGQVCGTTVENSPLPVDFARSSKPAGTACSGLTQTGYAKDGVPALDFQTVNPSAFGTVPATVTGGGNTYPNPYASVNGGLIGPVAKGWLPGDPVTGPYSGTAFSNVNNNDNGGTNQSTAYRLWCAEGGTGATGQITDWGQLTDLGPKLQFVSASLSPSSSTVTLPSTVGGQPVTIPSSIVGKTVTDSAGDIPASTTVGSISGQTITLVNGGNPVTPTGTSTTDTLIINVGSSNDLAVGSGLPIGLHVRIQGVNPTSGTTYTFTNYAGSGYTAGTNNCGTPVTGGAIPTVNQASDPNPATQGTVGTAAQVALENNASQVSDFAATNFPGDYASQAVEVATTLDFESNGVYQTDTYAASANINGQSFSSTKLTENYPGHGTYGTPSTNNLLNNQYPTARTLFNIYNTATIRASAAGFLNWLCDDNQSLQKGKDNSTGANINDELSSIISSYGFVRIADDSVAPTVLTGGTTPTVVSTPDDGLAAPNTDCASGTTTETLNGISGYTVGNGSPAVTAVAYPNS